MFTRLRVRPAAVLFLGTVLGPAAVGSAESAPPPGTVTPVVYTATVDGAIHPVSAEFMIRTMDLADRAGAALVIFTLRTPGGLIDSTRDIVTHMLAAKTPVV